MIEGLDDEIWFLFYQIIQGNIIKSKDRFFSEKKFLCFIFYNLWCDFLKFYVMWDVFERIEGFVEGIKDFDVVFIQEVYILNIGVVVFLKCVLFLVKVMEKCGFYYRILIVDFLVFYFG